MFVKTKGFFQIYSAVELVQTVQKVGKSCIVVLNPENMQLIQQTDAQDLQVWVAVNAVFFAVQSSTCLLDTVNHFRRISR